MHEGQADKDLAHKDLIKRDLPSWLSYIESLHPKSIAMGLERVKSVIARLKLNPKFTIITVAGTNGKGSTCAMLEQIYLQAGYQVGCYTSPHLLRYNERVRVNGAEVADAHLCAAFSAIESARIGNDSIGSDKIGDEKTSIQLTYFEVATLAAVWHFMQSGIDVAILEIGLGGRLDAVNAFEPHCTIVTSIDLDHQEFLGDTREKIGFEKAGIFRKGIPAICGDDDPPQSLIQYAKSIQADLKCIHQDFNYRHTGNGWEYLSGEQIKYTLLVPALKGEYQFNNASSAITAVESLRHTLPVEQDAINKAILQVTLAGRFQTVAKHANNDPKVILDVAHNPHAANALALNLKAYKQTNGKTFAVFAMLSDKDIQGVVEALKSEIDVWYIAGIEHIRAATAQELADTVVKVLPPANIKVYESIAQAYSQACIDISENDKIIVFGSFFTVSNVMQVIQSSTNL
ncbi:MAG TPA: bifunctional tetrahydrofolate synthase/dihydrofolate synthase [Methylotenera sp.]|nr:bifunctional tetrahydrofolate synthase/dihydrofolate synthase [Methylotenera sp.]